MHTLVKFNKNWADEFDVQHFFVCVDTTLEQTKQNVLENKVGQETWFGTNENWEEEEIELSDFTFHELSDKELTVFKKFFPDLAFGTGV